LSALSSLEPEGDGAAPTPLKDAAWQAGMPAFQSHPPARSNPALLFG
jgi:hypothetical protein